MAQLFPTSDGRPEVGVYVNEDILAASTRLAQNLLVLAEHHQLGPQHPCPQKLLLAVQLSATGQIPQARKPDLSTKRLSFQTAKELQVDASPPPRPILNST